ncbi:MAG: SCP2 sterol-binding domain-containing protein [Candidatus Baldrarchaeota archaeon]
MASIEKLIEQMKKFVEALNTKETAKKMVQEWLKGYYGKIFAFDFGEKKFYIVFTPEEVRFEEGEYPAPDLVIRTDVESWSAMATGKTKWSTLLKEGKLTIIGSAHEIPVLMKFAFAAGVLPTG